MCSAEEDLRTAERHIVALEQTIESIVELAADVDRGIIDLSEFRRETARRGRVPSYA